MKSAITLFALVSLVTAQSPPPGPWSAGAWNPNVGWAGTGINANGGAFWIGKNVQASCPTDITGLNCSTFPGDSTVFTGGNDTLYLDVAVPGGQQVYVGPDGALGFTPANSAELPNGSVETGFLRFQSQAGGAPVPIAFENDGFYACPVDESSDGVYQIFAYAYTSNSGNCTAFEMRTYQPADLNAWEYD